VTTVVTETVGLTPCPRCHGEPYLTVRYPHPSYRYPEQHPAKGMITVWLCPRCDAATPAAHGLLAYFAIHPDGDGSAEALAELITDWVAGLRHPPATDSEKFEQDMEAYIRGDYD
jgi:hypothetical protein